MSEALVSQVNVDAARQEIAPVIAAADALIIHDVDGHRQGLEMLGSVMGAIKRVKAIFAPALEAAMETKRRAETARLEVVRLQDSVLAEAEVARGVIAAKCGAFEAEERRVAALNQAAINAAALAKQDEERLLDAAMAETEEAAEDAMTVPLAPPVVPTVRPEVAKVAGVSARETWSAEVTDMGSFATWCVASGNLYMIEANQIALNSRARSEHAAMKIPGVRAVSKLTYAGR